MKVTLATHTKLSRDESYHQKVKPQTEDLENMRVPFTTYVDNMEIILSQITGRPELLTELHHLLLITTPGDPFHR